MSETYQTPRTDEIAHEGLNAATYIGRMTDHARRLERELAEARKDTARLDWVMANIESIGPAPTEANPHPKHKWLFTAPLHDNVKSAIDAALR